MKQNKGTKDVKNTKPDSKNNSPSVGVEPIVRMLTLQDCLGVCPDPNSWKSLRRKIGFIFIKESARRTFEREYEQSKLENILSWSDDDSMKYMFQFRFNDYQEELIDRFWVQLKTTFIAGSLVLAYFAFYVFDWFQ